MIIVKIGCGGNVHVCTAITTHFVLTILFSERKIRNCHNLRCHSNDAVCNSIVYMSVCEAAAFAYAKTSI